MFLWLFGVGILSVAVFHRSIPLPGKYACFYWQIFPWSLQGIQLRSGYSFLFISKFFVESFDIPSNKLQRISPSLGCRSHVCRPAFILCIWLACRWLHYWKEGFISVTGCGYLVFSRKNWYERLWLLTGTIQTGLSFLSSQLQLQLFVIN